MKMFIICFSLMNIPASTILSYIFYNNKISYLSSLICHKYFVKLTKMNKLELMLLTRKKKKKTIYWLIRWWTMTLTTMSKSHQRPATCIIRLLQWSSMKNSYFSVQTYKIDQKHYTHVIYSSITFNFIKSTSLIHDFHKIILFS